MTLLLNILWIIFGGGFVIWLEYMVAGVLLCLTVVGIPFGLQCFKLAWVGLLPFGKEFVPDRAPSAIGFGLNVLWLLLAGIWIFLSHIALALPLAASLIGIPFAWQHLKFAMLALAPFGQRVKG